MIRKQRVKSWLRRKYSGHGLEGRLPARKRQSNLVRGKLAHQKDKQGLMNSPRRKIKSQGLQ